MIILYVDDLVIGEKDLSEINKVELKDLHELHYFLGIEVIRTPVGILICQRHYVLNLLYKFGLTKCKPVFTPIDQNLKIDADSSTAMCDPTKYRQMIDNLIYLTITQPDLSYSVGLLSQFMQHSRNLHLDCAKRILRYVRLTMDYGIVYKSNATIRLEGYTYTDWAGYIADR